MYYEEKMINGILHYRNSPNGDWIRKEPAPTEDNTQSSHAANEIQKLCDVSIEYCDKYLEKGILEFNGFKQSLTTIKALAQPSQPDKGEGQGADIGKATYISEMDKAVKCLALELPEPVWDDVNKKWQNLKSSIKG